MNLFHTDEMRKKEHKGISHRHLFFYTIEKITDFLIKRAIKVI